MDRDRVVVRCQSDAHKIYEMNILQFLHSNRFAYYYDVSHSQSVSDKYCSKWKCEKMRENVLGVIRVWAQQWQIHMLRNKYWNDENDDVQCNENNVALVISSFHCVLFLSFSL